MDRETWADRAEGNPAAFAAKLYNELKLMARRQLSRERFGHTLQATALVHEAYLRLAKRRVEGLDREHFLALASTTMRRVLIDYARRRASGRRGASPLRVAFDESLKL